MVALLMFAAGFALGLFFGWLLHRERVERAVYEDVARTRDRATSALAETSARLELANKDMIRLRRQLTDAHRLLDERNATIADLEAHPSERVATAAVGDHDRGLSIGVTEAAGGGGSPFAADLPVSAPADADDVDDDAEITEEVTLVGPGDAEPSVVADAAVGTPAPHEDRAVPAPVDEAPRAAPVEQLTIAESGVVVAGEDGGEPAVAEPAAVAVGTDALVGSARDRGAGVPDADAAAAEPAVASDDLQRITGIGPALERALHTEGIRTFAQVAALDDAAIADLQTRAPRLVSRLRRGGWVAQARRLHAEARGDDT